MKLMFTRISLVMGMPFATESPRWLISFFSTYASIWTGLRVLGRVTTSLYLESLLIEGSVTLGCGAIILSQKVVACSLLAHSTWDMATSWALFRDICASASWASPHTYITPRHDGVFVGALVFRVRSLQLFIHRSPALTLDMRLALYPVLFFLIYLFIFVLLFRFFVRQTLCLCVHPCVYTWT